MKSAETTTGPQADPASRERALRFVNFLTAAVTPFHAVAIGSQMLESAGFVALDEAASWTGALKPGGKYFYTRCDSTLVAFAVGGKYTPGGPMKIVGAHTDSPALKTKPLTKFGTGPTEGLTQLSVVTYGGGLWHTWFDRDLGIGGLVLLRAPDGSLSKRLVAIRAPVLRIPSLCIHLQTASERESFAPNKETHLVPILCIPPAAAGAAAAAAKASAGASSKAAPPAASEPADPFAAAQEPELLALLGAQLGVAPSEIASLDLTLFDAQPPQLTGARGEFVSGGRLDNLASTFVALDALIDACAPAGGLAADDGIRCIALFDHEEVGSASAAGAGGPVMEEAISRVGEALGVPPKGELALRALRRSFLLSLDNAHAVHPNYRSKHEAAHRPQMGRGCVIKNNANMRYATDSVTSFVVRELGKMAGAPTQEFVVKNDCPCGSTIGPILAERLGVRAADVGMPQLSMHSCRELMGSDDLTHCYKLLCAFFGRFEEVDSRLGVCKRPRVDSASEALQ